MVRRATKWLLDRQRADGWFCDPSMPSASLAHAFATAAFASTYVTSEHRPYRAPAEGALAPFERAKDPGLGEPLSAALHVLATRGMDRELVAKLLPASQRLAGVLGDSGLSSADAGNFPFIGPNAGTRDLATMAVVMASVDGGVLSPKDPRWPAITKRVRELPSRAEREGSLYDASSLWCGSQAAFAIGGETWAAYERFLGEKIVPRLIARDGTGSIQLTCGPEVLRNEVTETALIAAALGSPWFRLGH